MLRAFLIAEAQRLFVWGEADCCLFLADWWRACHGIDPAAHLRGTYSSEAEADALLERAGGKYRMVAGQARIVGARTAVDPVPGDFGIVRLGGKHWAAIHTPDLRWAARSPTGLYVFRPETIVRAWAIRCD